MQVDVVNTIQKRFADCINAKDADKRNEVRFTLRSIGFPGDFTPEQMKSHVRKAIDDHGYSIVGGISGDTTFRITAKKKH